MIVYDKEQKQIVIPNGLGNVNIIINGGGDCPECPEQPGCNLGIGEYYFNTDDLGTYELYAENDGYDGWSKMFVHLDGGAIKVWRAANLLVNEYPDYGTKKYVGGEITEIQEVIQDCYKTYVLDNRLKIYRGGWFDGICFNDYDKPIKVGDYVIVYGVLQDNNGELIIEEGSQVVAYQECTGGEGGGCNLQDKWITPSMGERDDNGFIVVEEAEEYDGLSRVVIDPQTLYNEGLEAGRAEGGEGSGCTLTSRTFTSNGVYRPEALQMPVIWFTSDKPSAYDTGIKLVDDSWVEIYFRATEGGDTPTLIGCEEGDWNNTAFATRWYDNNLGVKIGRNEIGIPYTAGDDKLHKLKFGKTVGVWFDDVKVSDIAGEEWAPTDRTIYIGAMNDPSNNNEKGFWRYWVGFIGDVTVYGSLNGNVAEYHFKAGDYGRWGEFKRVEDDTNLRNLGGDGMAIAQTGSYGEAPDGFSEVTVNVPQHNLGVLDWTLTSPSTEVKNASDDGYDGYSQVIIRPENVIAQEKENAINDFKNKMKEITITQNGTFSIDDQINIKSLKYNGGYHTDTISTYDINRIEVAFKADTSESINGGTYPFILGGSLLGLSELPENSGNNACARAIQYGYGRIVGYWEGKHTGAAGTMDGEWLTIVLDESGMTVKYPTYEEHSDYVYDNGQVNGGSDIFPFIIGGQGSRGGADESGNRTSNLIANSQFRGLIKEIKVNTNSMGEITYIPKDLGVWDRKVENTGEFLSALAPTEGEVTMNGEPEKKYPYGFKRVEVNVVPQISIKEAGLNVWYNDLTRITDENNQINSDWDQALRGETIQNVFPGIAMTISGQAVAKPFFINAVNGNSTATRIGKLVSSAYGTPVSCAVVIIGSFDCKNIQNVDIEAFKYMTDLCFIDGMNGLGESFISPQTINFTYCTNLFIKTNSRKFISNFAESLFDLSAGNKNGINTSTLRFKSAVQERSENADAIALMRSKGWTVEFVSSDL